MRAMKRGLLTTYEIDGNLTQNGKLQIAMLEKYGTVYFPGLQNTNKMQRESKAVSSLSPGFSNPTDIMKQQQQNKQ